MTQQVLGCPQGYAALITHRGGGSPVGVLDGLTSVQWDRKYNGVGEATIALGQGQVSGSCCQLLNQLAQDEAQGAYEVHVYRDNAMVWCGPIQTVTETFGPTTPNNFVITAKDILRYLERHYLQAGYNITADVVDLAAAVIGADLVSDDPGIGIGIVTTQAGVTVSRAAARASASVLGELNTLLASGLRFTTVGRALYLGGQRGTPFGAPIRLAITDIAGTVTMLHDASAFANTVYGLSGGAAAQIPAGVTPPDDPQLVVIGAAEAETWRGRMESAVTATTGGTNSASSVAAAASAAYFAARRPRVLRIADNSQISPTAPVTVDQLICGSVVKIAANGELCTFVPQDLQLVRVQGTFDQNGEKIGISLGPVN